MSPRKRVFHDIYQCARCGKDHRRLLRREFRQSVRLDAVIRFDWWLRCPTTGDPILLRELRMRRTHGA